MTFLSYAQNFEDVLLWRALRDVPNGFYLDVGAQHPVIDSVSRAFYDAGWRGMHVEATPAYAAMLRADRPNEIVIEAALSDEPGLITLYEFPDTGLSTGDRAIADMHNARGLSSREIIVPCLTLSDLFTKIGERAIHWLKVDVEGMEAKVLAGWGTHPQRPWVLVVESTLPNSTIPTHMEWIDELKSRGYIETFFDGLSRYFVAADYHHLREFLHTPANVFDGFALSGTAANTMCSQIKENHARAIDRLNDTHANEIEVLNSKQVNETILLNEKIITIEKTVRHQRRELSVAIRSMLKAERDHIAQASAAEERHRDILHKRIADERIITELRLNLSSIYKSFAWRVGRKMGLFSRPSIPMNSYYEDLQEISWGESKMTDSEISHDNGHQMALSDFDNLHDLDFLHQAYRRILKRDPDTNGQNHYLSRLRSGHSKSEIIVDLVKSSEARQLNTKVIGQTPYRIVAFIGRIPVLGRIIEGVIFIFRAREFTQEVRALENYTYRLKEHLNKARQ